MQHGNWPWNQEDNREMRIYRTVKARVRSEILVLDSFGTDMPRRELSLTVRTSPVGLAGRCSACLLPTGSRYYAKPTRPEINDIPERHKLQGKQICTTVTEMRNEGLGV